MREMHGQFSKVFRTRDGNKFYGELGIPDTNTSMHFRPRRTLTVGKDAAVETGDVVSGDTGTFLVSLSSGLSKTLQFKCFEITSTLAWTRVGEQIDFVTGLPRDAQLIVLDLSLPVVVEHGSIVENKGLEVDKYQILTGAAVKVGDRLGSWLVQTIMDSNGLNLLEVA